MGPSPRACSGGPALAVAALAALAAPCLGESGPPDTGSRFGAVVDGRVVYRATGPTTLLEVVEPRLIKSYLPQELMLERSARSWEYTNYAGDRYQRYLDPGLWGENFYDLYGDHVARGHMIYNWTEDHPRSAESSVVFGGGLIVAADSRDGDALSILVGGGRLGSIFTSLTPLTFRKAVYKGTQLHFQNDRLELTGLFSRISNPEPLTSDPYPLNNYTNLVGGRVQLPVHDRVTVGGVVVNAHNMRGEVSSFEGNPLHGEMSSSQLERGIDRVIVRVTDDSPDDGRGGGVLLWDDVEVITQIAGRDTVLVGSQIGFAPRRVGGAIRGGARVADGTDRIELSYDLAELGAVLDDADAVNAIRDLRFHLLLMNDYRIEVTSNQQTNAEGQPVFLPVASAPGNVDDATNRREVVFEYGVPTGSQVGGASLEVRDLLGFDLYTEYDVSRGYRKYPSSRYPHHQAHAGVRGDPGDHAFTLELVRKGFPWDVAIEAFSIDRGYNTSPYIVDGNGRIDYADSTHSIYDFVDDNDDDDRQPDQERWNQDARSDLEIAAAGGEQRRGAADPAVFPGWDQNLDFISDFNQNDTFFRPSYVPDYEEPFLRYAVDHPDVLFGIDLNNNGWIDSFENDEEPDYPYKGDRQGCNAYLRWHPVAGLQVTGGQARERTLSDDRRNQTTYLLLGFERTFAMRGRVRLFGMTKRAHDDIQEDLVQWIQPTGEKPGNRAIDDPLFARDAWIHTAWLACDNRSVWGPNWVHILKYEAVRQAEGGRAAGLSSSRLLGLVNKGDWPLRFGPLTVWPKLKSELLVDDRPFSIAGHPVVREQWTRTATLQLTLAVLRQTQLQLGIEWLSFSDDHLREADLERGDPTQDYRSTVIAGQLVNKCEYLGYALTTNLGVRARRRSEERAASDRESTMDSTAFATLYAGLRD